MFFGNTTTDTRQLFFSSWSKYRNQQELNPLEQQITQVIIAHPEYHPLLEAENVDAQYYPELGQTNPFLHMGLHLAIHEQISTNRPAGITAVYQSLVNKYHDPLEVEHMIMEYLVECLWQAQRNNSLPDENHYLNQCQQLLGVNHE